VSACAWQHRIVRSRRDRQARDTASAYSNRLRLTKQMSAPITHTNEEATGARQDRITLGAIRIVESAGFPIGRITISRPPAASCSSVLSPWSGKSLEGQRYSPGPSRCARSWPPDQTADRGAARSIRARRPRSRARRAAPDRSDLGELLRELEYWPDKVLVAGPCDQATLRPASAIATAKSTARIWLPVRSALSMLVRKPTSARSCSHTERVHVPLPCDKRRPSQSPSQPLPHSFQRSSVGTFRKKLSKSFS
jgi:hypothetical protein